MTRTRWQASVGIATTATLTRQRAAGFVTPGRLLDGSEPASYRQAHTEIDRARATGMGMLQMLGLYWQRHGGPSTVRADVELLTGRAFSRLLDLVEDPLRAVRRTPDPRKPLPQSRPRRPHP